MVRTVFDFQRSFRQAVVSNAMEAKAEDEAKAGVLRAPAVFEHPLGQGETSITYQVDLPRLSAGERLTFLSYLGIRSGARLKDEERPFDGVAFSLLVNGERRFRQVVLDADPHSVLVDLTALAGQRATISLNTDCNGQSNWDWALWLGPRLVVVSEGSRPAPCGELVLFQARGLRGLERDDPVRALAGEPAAAGKQVLVEWWMPHSQLEDKEWHLGMVEFSAPESDRPVDIVAGPGLEIREVQRMSRLPELALESVCAQRVLIWPGEQVRLAAKIRNLGGSPLLPQDECLVALRVEGQADLLGPAELAVAQMPARSEAEAAWEIRTKQIGEVRLQADLKWAYDAPCGVTETIRVPPAPTPVSGQAAEQVRITPAGNDLVLETPALRLHLVGDGAAYHYGLVYIAEAGTYKLLGALWPLSRVVYQGRERARTWTVVPRLAERGARWVDLAQTFTDETGAEWTASLRFQLSQHDPWIETRYRLFVDRTRNLLHFAGPTLLAGERCFGSSKDSALFPGLEALEGEEPSSSTRDLAPPLNLRYAPNIYKITIPLLAVSDGESTLGLMWDMNRQWSPGHLGLAARFASPNFKGSHDNHLMGVFVPTPPEWNRENEEIAEEPYVLEAESGVTLASQILVAPGNAFASVWQWDKRHGFPEPLPWPRSVEKELALCRKGFMQTVWDPVSKKSRHCIDWGPANSPGFATLLWWGSLLTRNPHQAQRARERALFIGRQGLQEGGPGGLWSGANCHIMRWEFPFYFGHLDEAFDALRQHCEGLLKSQEPDGSWRFHPDEQRASLGKAGDAVLGTCAGPAYNLWRYARLTGDPRFLAAGEKTLLFMRRFRVPRGAQAWECPLYEPDILAAAYAILAYTEAYRATGDAQWLEDAEYWAQSGIPFVYAWRLPNRPAMQHATIPVFGSTFFTHSWLGLPVQWNGLVYAYGLFHLADSATPRADFWRKLAQGITVSGAYQQFDFDDQRSGCYPDSYNVWTDARNPAYINPEDIMVNLLAALGHDPDISSARTPSPVGGPAVHVSSGARVVNAEIKEAGLLVRLRFFPGEATYSLVTNAPEPQEVSWEGRPLPRLTTLTEGDEGWVYNNNLLFIRVQHQTPEGELVVRLWPR